MDDPQLMRYARHILLDEVGIEGQSAFLNAHVLIIGAGGLGSPAALYLATSGVGQITLVDDDVVELSNLQRQILHTTDHLGLTKVDSAKRTLLAYNQTITINTVCSRTGTGNADANANANANGGHETLHALVARADVVLDCCDNFPTRHAVNRACVALGKPLVSGAAIRFDAQISVFDLRDASAPCYHCLFPEAEDVDALSCATTGVFAPLVGIVGSVQAAEALKLIAGIGESLSGRLLMLDALSMQWRSLNVERDPSCTVCANRPAHAL